MSNNEQIERICRNNRIISFGKLILINLMGYFSGLVLSSGFTIDLFKAYYLSKSTRRAEIVISAIVFDRIVGLFSLLLISAVGLTIFDGVLEIPNLGFYITGIASLFIILLLIFINKNTFRFLESKLLKIFIGKIGEKIITIHESFLEIKKETKILILLLVLSILIQCIRILMLWLIAISLEIRLPISYLIVIVPVMYIFALLPISFGGIGVREGTLVGFFTIVGLAASDGFIMAFINSIFDILIAFFGGIVLVFYKAPEISVAK